MRARGEREKGQGTKATAKTRERELRKSLGERKAKNYKITCFDEENILGVLNRDNTPQKVLLVLDPMSANQDLILMAAAVSAGQDINF